MLRFALLGLMFIAAPAMAAVKTINGISVDTSLPQVSRGVYYSTTISPSGTGAAAGPYTFALVNAGTQALPANFSLTSSGVVSGITCDPNVNGTYNFGVRITAAGGAVANFTTNPNDFGVNVTAGPGSACALTITISSLPTTGTVGLNYSGTATASGGTAPYTWSVTSGSLPPGVTLNTSTGTLSGIPTAPGTFPLR